jgi:hypothetical protein
MSDMQEHKFLNEMHSKFDLEPFLHILYKDSEIGGLNFMDLMMHCFSITNTGSQPFKLIRRAERLMILLRFLIHAIEKSNGPIAECGVFRGFSAVAMNMLVSKKKSDALNQIYLIDSFEGLSEPVEEDWILLNTNENKSAKGPAMAKGHFATPIEMVQKNFENVKNVKLVKGWIPDAFENLPEELWSFVHLDVDLYKPILDSLEYFYPRMNKGGIIINDDYKSVLFPGAGKAWREFFEKKNESYLILDTGQSIFIKK